MCTFMINLFVISALFIHVAVDLYNITNILQLLHEKLDKNLQWFQSV